MEQLKNSFDDLINNLHQHFTRCLNEGSFQGASAILIDLEYVLNVIKCFDPLYHFDDVREKFNDYRYSFFSRVIISNLDCTYNQINGYLMSCTSGYWDPAIFSNDFDELLEDFCSYCKYVRSVDSLPDDEECSAYSD